MWAGPVGSSVSGCFHSGQFVLSLSASLSGVCLSLVHQVQPLHLSLEEERESVCDCVCVCKHEIVHNMHSWSQAQRSTVVVQGAATLLEQHKVT